MNTSRLSIAALLVLVIFANANAEEKTLKKGAKEVSHAVGAAFRDVGQGTKKATKAIGHGIAAATRETGHAFRDFPRRAERSHAQQ